jgi:hypothetical protein
MHHPWRTVICLIQWVQPLTTVRKRDQGFTILHKQLTMSPGLGLLKTIVKKFISSNFNIIFMIHTVYTCILVNDRALWRKVCYRLQWKKYRIVWRIRSENAIVICTNQNTILYIDVLDHCKPGLGLLKTIVKKFISSNFNIIFMIHTVYTCILVSLENYLYHLWFL